MPRKYIWRWTRTYLHKYLEKISYSSSIHIGAQVAGRRTILQSTFQRKRLSVLLAVPNCNLQFRSVDKLLMMIVLSVEMSNQVDNP